MNRRMSPDDVVRLAAVQRTLSPADAEALARCMAQASAPPLEPWQLRQARLDGRDNAIRCALAAMEEGLSATARARRLAVALLGHIGSHGSAPAPPDISRELLRDIITLNNDTPLGSRQIENIAAGHRGR